MLRTNHFTNTIILLLISCGCCLAQSEPLWKLKIAHDWHQITSLGYVVVGSTGRLSAVDPETGVKLWERTDLGTVKEPQVEEIAGTSLLKISYGVDPGEEDMPMIAIVDTVTGTLLFDSNKEDLGVLGIYPMTRSGNLLVVGVKPGQFFATLLMYSLESGAMLWRNAEIFKASSGDKGGILGKMAATVKSALDMQSLIAFPVEIDEQSLIIIHPSYAIRLGSKDGKQIWRSGIDESVQASVTYSPFQPGQIFVGASRESATNMMAGPGTNTDKSYFTTYFAFDLNTGRQLWKTKPVGEQLNITIPLENGLAVFYSNNPKGSFNLLDYATGNGLWGNKGKGLKTSGSLVEYIQTPDGIVLASGGIGPMTSRGVEYYLNVLDDKLGALKFDNSVKVKGRLMSTEITPKGILYTTTHEVNILDPKSGSLILSSSIESEAARRNFDRPFPVASTETHLYAFATGKRSLMELNKQTGVVRQMNSAPIELGGKEVPKSIDLFAEGVVLSSDQNVVMVGFDGLVKHAKYYQPPSQSGWVRAISLAEAIKSTYIGVLTAGAALAINAEASTVGDKDVKRQGQIASVGVASISVYAFAYAGKAFNDFRRRVKATTITDEYLLLLHEPIKRDIKLLQVDKRTGEVLTTMDIGKDRDPVYSVDFIDRRVYYLSGPNELTCFRIK